MNTAKLSSLRRSLDATHEQYNVHFAGQLRLTRSVEMIKLMIEAVQSIRREASGIRANGEAVERQALIELCDERLELYRSELGAILEARREAGEDGVEAALLGTRANFIFSRYHRHFAGHNRSTRDVSLLLEMRAELETIRAQMQALAAAADDESMRHDLAVVEEYLGLFCTEETEIRAARDGGTLEDQAGTLAKVANDQFALYDLHFAHHPRISRRPELLERMIGNLEVIHDKMSSLRAVGHHSEHNARNIEIVAGRLDTWRQELEEVREARAATPMIEVVQALSDAIDPVLAAYNEHFAGQPRETRNLDLLTALCDALSELEVQMERIGAVERLTTNERSLQMVRDALLMFGKEWQAIAEVQDPPSF